VSIPTITGGRAWFALLGLLLAAGCGSRPSTGELRAYDLSLSLRADGSLRVEERARVTFPERTVQRFVLPVPDARVDAIDGLVVTVDGTEAGEPGVELRQEPGGGLSWTGPSGSELTHEFTLAYDAQGVMAVRGARGVFIWPGLPGGTGVVDEVSVRLEWPEGSVPMQGPAVGGDGWQVSAAGTRAVMTATRVDRASTPLVYIDLVLSDVSVREPAWQVAELQARQLAPAFVSAGVFFVVVAAGILVMVRIRHPPVVVQPGGAVSDVPEEIGAALSHVSAWRTSQASLEPLVSAGLLDPERLAVGRGLRLSGLAVCLAAAGVAAVIPLTIGDLGPTPFAVPAGLAASGVMLLLRGVAFPVLTEAGAEVAMLHSRRLRPSREP
jgi:hypothetical protein